MENEKLLIKTEAFGVFLLPPLTQNAILFYTCICQSEVSYNFTEEFIEQKL